MKTGHLIWIIICFVVMAAPAVNAGKQLLHDQKYRERDRIAVKFANDTAYWTAFYTWVSREGATK